MFSRLLKSSLLSTFSICSLGIFVVRDRVTIRNEYQSRCILVFPAVVCIALRAGKENKLQVHACIFHKCTRCTLDLSFSFGIRFLSFCERSVCHWTTLFKKRGCLHPLVLQSLTLSVRFFCFLRIFLYGLPCACVAILILASMNRLFSNC